MLAENYKELLFAIFNSDNKENNKAKRYGIICVYDTLNEDRLIAIFNTAETCANFFGTTENTIKSAICRKHLRNCRYRIERVKLEDD